MYSQAVEHQLALRCTTDIKNKIAVIPQTGQDIPPRIGIHGDIRWCDYGIESVKQPMNHKSQFASLGVTLEFTLHHGPDHDDAMSHLTLPGQPAALSG